MLGKDYFKVVNKIDLSSERYKALILFYAPLIGYDALYLYQFLLCKGELSFYEEINKLLNSLLISIEKLEDCLNKLNQYKLIKTFKNKDKDYYIFELINPLNSVEFIKDDIFVRDFILKTSGNYYQSLISNIRSEETYQDYVDISKKINPHILDNWTNKDETFLKEVKSNNNQYSFNTIFDINKFLSDISTNLLPMRFRTEANLKEIATCADLYNISYEKMKHFIPRIAKSDSNSLDLTLLKYLCQNATQEFHTINNGIYDVPCSLFLMNKQGGQEISNNDAKILYSLSHDYHLNPSVINVLIEYGLNSCDNCLIEKYLYAIASDLKRNNVTDADTALNRLGKNKKKNKNKLNVSYSNDDIQFDEKRFEEIIKNRGNNG